MVFYNGTDLQTHKFITMYKYYKRKCKKNAVNGIHVQEYTFLFSDDDGIVALACFI